MKIVAFLSVSILFSAVATTVQAQYGKSPGGKLLKSDKIFDVVNVMQIPLTASENYLVGSVKSVISRDCHLVEKKGEQRKMLDDTAYNGYDHYGHLVDQNIYSVDGSFNAKCTYNYDDENRATDWAWKISGRVKIDSRITFKYDRKGNKIEEKIIDKDSSKSRIVTYKYDKKGRETAEDYYFVDGSLKNSVAFEYDSRGNQVTYISKNGVGKLVHKLTCTYDDNGNKISGASYDSDSLPPSKWVRKNDSKGRCIEMTDYKPDGSFDVKTTFKYDGKDNVLEQNSYKENGSVDTTRTNVFRDFEYDKTGNVLNYTTYKLKSGNRVPLLYTEFVYVYY